MVENSYRTGYRIGNMAKIQNQAITLQSVFLLIAISLSFLFQEASATRLVVSRVGSCYRKRAYGIIRMRKFECQRMGGRWNGKPGRTQWTDCHLDWCEVPGGRNRRVTRGKAWYVCPDRKQRSGNGRTYGIIRMKRYECDLLNGKMNGSPAQQSWMNCHLYWCGFNGYNKDRIWGIIPQSVGRCGNLKMAYGIIRMKFNECRALRGRWNGRPGTYSWTDCHLDWCISESV